MFCFNANETCPAVARRRSKLKSTKLDKFSFHICIDIARESSCVQIAKDVFRTTQYLSAKGFEKVASALDRNSTINDCIFVSSSSKRSLTIIFHLSKVSSE